jgi:hypothetical protein
MVMGSTGAAGSEIVRQCLRDPRIVSVLALSRRPFEVTDVKLRVMQHRDFSTFLRLLRHGGPLSALGPMGLANRQLQDAIFGAAHRFSQEQRRLVQRLVGETKGAPMHGHQETRAELAERARSLTRVDVLRPHEPARLVRADRQHHQVERTRRLGNRAEFRM